MARNKNQQIKSRQISEEMKESFIDYALSVIISRALPDVRDGLKPVQRRILYTMHEMGLNPGSPFRKSAQITGHAMAAYHPHGDQAIYNALVRLAQDFSLRYPLIQGQGNFGSLDGDPPASMRYSEVKLSKVGQEMLQDIEKNTVEFQDNYDATRQEPQVLPSPLPQLLLNGSTGIAVGMATNIPPHNLSELIEAVIYLIDHPEASTEDLFQFFQGPDFPGAGAVYDREGIIQAYSRGRGAILMRGKAQIVKKGRQNQILISEIPFQVNKSALVQRFADLVRKKKLEGVKDIRDESDREGIRIVIDVSQTAYPGKILNRLFKFTDLQRVFHLNMLALVDGIQPRVLSLKEVLGLFVEHRQEVVVKRTRFDLEKAKARAHILEGLEKALKKIDQVIKTIKASAQRQEAKQNLIKKFKLTSQQAEAILEMKLSSLARLERKKISSELSEKERQIKELSALLKSPKKIKAVIKTELKELKEKYGDSRRTRVFSKKIGKIPQEHLIAQRPTIITLTREGYIKRIRPSSLRRQRRGGKGILGMTTTGQDFVSQFLSAKTLDSLLFFTDSGKVFSLPVYEIPQQKRLAKGKAVQGLLNLSSQEQVLSLIPLPKEAKEEAMGFLVMVTKKGIIKKTELKDFERITKAGLIAIKLKKNDLLKGVGKSRGQDELILVTKKGQAIRFQEKEIRAMGRTAAGVKGIRLKKGDEVMGMEIIKRTKNKEQRTKKAKKYLLVVMENGYGKRTKLSEYKLQKRGGMGLKTAKLNKKTGQLIASKLITNQEDLIVISQKGKMIRTKISSVSVLGRATQGVRIMKLEKGDKVASIAVI